MKTLLQIGLYIIIIVLGYFIYQSIMEPIRFNRETAVRERMIINRLKDVREIQLAHRARFGKFNSDLDSLVHFIKNDSLIIITAIGTVPDTLTEAEAVRKGIVRRDTTWIRAINSWRSDSLPIVHKSVPDTLTKEQAEELNIFHYDTTWIPGIVDWKQRVRYPIDSLPYVPFSEGKRFEMQAGTIIRGLVTIPVFEAKTVPKDYMIGLNYRVYYTREEGLRVGSMTESSIDGNWE